MCQVGYILMEKCETNEWTTVALNSDENLVLFLV